MTAKKHSNRKKSPLARDAMRSDAMTHTCVEALERRELFATFTVTNNLDAGAGSLRQAIISANATSAADTIQFQSSTFILLQSQLPTITQPLTIDGDGVGSPGVNSQVGLGGASAGNAHGLVIDSSNVTIRGLNIGHFQRDGITIISGTNNRITSCFIGTSNAANGPSPNGGHGISVYTAGNTIGGTTLAERNTIGANEGHGIYVYGFFQAGTGNVITGNRIGPGAGDADLGNGGDGIALESSGNRVGASTNAQGGTGARNVISGNGGSGVRIERIIQNIIEGSDFGPDANDNVVAGNYIGTSTNGTVAIRNERHGVHIINGLRNTIGSSDAVGRNILSGNRRRGLTIESFSDQGLVGSTTDNVAIGNYIGLAADGDALPNINSGVAIFTPFTSNNRIGGTTAGERNVIGSNGGAGIAIQDGASGNLVQGNYIGTDPAGNAARPNFEAGVFIGDSQGNTIGGRFASQRNVISGNDDDGVRILSTDAGSTAGNSNLVYNNYIGTNAAGAAALPNTLFGVRIVGGSNNKIGDIFVDTGPAGNLISGNALSGIGVGSDTPDFTEVGTTSNNSIVNNSIGTNAAGTAAITNLGGGILLVDTATVPTTGTVIGGANVGSQRRGNTIVSDGNRYGVDITHLASGTSLLGNRIGTNAAGTALLGAIGNPVIANGPSTTIGSATAGTGNVIGGGASAGILINDIAALNVTIAGNFIGTDQTGTINLGNVGAGIAIDTGSNFGTPNFMIGGTTNAAGNVIAFNSGDGININTGRDVEITRNRIYSNLGLGIDLSPNGVTANDVGDSDSGPNSLQNYPVLTSAGQVGTDVTVSTTLNAIASTSYRIDYYAVIVSDASGSGEANAFLGSLTVTTNASGNANAAPTLSLVGTTGATAITATATRQGTFQDTSEFAVNRPIVPVQPISTWNGNGDGLNWSDPFNWEAGVVPGPNDDVYIQDPVAENVFITEPLTVVRKLVLGLDSVSNPKLRVSAGNRVLRVTELQLNGTSYIDLNHNDLIVDYNGASPRVAVQSMINSGRSAGAWDGPGINSLAAKLNPQHNTTLGLLEATEFKSIYGLTATFSGQSVDDTTLLIKYTYYGDADFSGHVTFDDYARIDNGFSTNKTGWLNGDFDGNGSVNFDDYSLIDLAFNTQSSPQRPIADVGRGGAKSGKFTVTR